LPVIPACRQAGNNPCAGKISTKISDAGQVKTEFRNFQGKTELKKLILTQPKFKLLHLLINKIMKALKFIFAAIIFILLYGCEKEKIANTINSDILVSAKIENNNIYILAETVKEFECITYSITNSFQINGNEIIIEFLDVLKPEGCYAAFGPARTEINLGVLEESVYQVSFKLDGEETKAKLSVSQGVSMEITQSGNVKLR